MRLKYTQKMPTVFVVSDDQGEYLGTVMPEEYTVIKDGERSKICRWEALSRGCARIGYYDSKRKAGQALVAPKSRYGRKI